MQSKRIRKDAKNKINGLLDQAHTFILTTHHMQIDDSYETHQREITRADVNEWMQDDYNMQDVRIRLYFQDSGEPSHLTIDGQYHFCDCIRADIKRSEIEPAPITLEELEDQIALESELEDQIALESELEERPTLKLVPNMAKEEPKLEAPVNPNKLFKEKVAELFHFINSEPREKIELLNSEMVKQLFKIKLAEKKREHFVVTFLDSQMNVIKIKTLFKGGINACGVDVAEVAKKALKYNANAVILAHNHPAGKPEFSPSDLAITQQIKEALSLFKISVIDHILVADKTISMRECGQL